MSGCPHVLLHQFDPIHLKHFLTLNGNSALTKGLSFLINK